MALYMLSTDTAVSLIRGTSRILDERIASAVPEELCISAVTRGELLLGLSHQNTPTSEDEPTPEVQPRKDAPQNNVRRALRTIAKAHMAASPIDPATTESLRKITLAALANLTPSEAKALRLQFAIDPKDEDLMEKLTRQFEATREQIRSLERQPRERAREVSRVVDQFLARVSCVPWDANAATHFATIAVELHGMATPLSTADTMIAGHAVALGAVLVVGNENRFSRVGGLKTENWTRRRPAQ